MSKSKTEISIGRILVTPDMAIEWLDLQKNNRTISKTRVDAYAADMLAGLWRSDTGDGLRFDKAGNLIDGQHRLWAIVQSQKPIWMLVMRNVAEDAFMTIDTGKPRNCADTLSVIGADKSRQIASGLRYLWMHERGCLFTGYHGGAHRKITNMEIIQMYNRHPKMKDAYAFIEEGRKHKAAIIQPSVAGFLFYMCAKKDEAKARKFWGHIKTSTEVPPEGPIFLLHERLIRNKLSKAKLPVTEIIAISIKAWNAFVTGDKMRCLKWQRETEDPPEFV